MWVIDAVDSIHGNTYILRNTRTGGYLADNKGGVIHFADSSDAEEIATALNNYETY